MVLLPPEVLLEASCQEKSLYREMVPSVHFMGCVIPNEADDILVSLAYHLLLKLSYWLLRVYLKGVTSNENCDFREAS